MAISPHNIPVLHKAGDQCDGNVYAVNSVRFAPEPARDCLLTNNAKRQATADENAVSDDQFGSEMQGHSQWGQQPLMESQCFYLWL